MKSKYKKITLRNFKKLFYEIKDNPECNNAILIKLLKKYMVALDAMFLLDIISIDTCISVCDFCNSELEKISKEMC